MNNSHHLIGLRSIALVIGMLLSTSTLVYAQTKVADDKGNAASNSAEMSTGEIRKIDKEAGKITIRHGEIKNLDMPAMTMVFVVKNPSQIEKLQVGDKVKFSATNESGKFTVTSIVAGQ